MIYCYNIITAHKEGDSFKKYIRAYEVFSRNVKIIARHAAKIPAIERKKCIYKK